MKKLLAQIINPVIDPKYGNIDPEIEGGVVQNPLAPYFVNIWRAMVIAGALATIFYMIWGAFDWLTSEGNQEKLTAARNKMIHAVAGMGFLAASVAIVYLIDALNIFGFSLLRLEWPKP